MSGISRRDFARASIAGAFLSRAGTLRADGAAPPIRAVTRGPKHHFFGYYDKCPWNRSGRYLLALENDFCDRQPKPGESVRVGMIDLLDGDRFATLDESAAWSWQQGNMLQWLGDDSESSIVYNSADRDGYRAVVRDVRTGASRVLPLPIYAVSNDGKQAVTLPFDRLNRLRPGYGYMALPERFAADPAPKETGISRMDMKSGEHHLIISIAWAAENRRDDRFKDAHHWFNHLQFNPSGDRFVFLHRWRKPSQETRHTRMYSAKPDGSDVRLLWDNDMVSHFDWRDDRTMLAWARMDDKKDRFVLKNVDTGEAEVVGYPVLDRDGHCSYSPDRKHILNDTYPDAQRQQTLMLYRVTDGKRTDVGKFFLDRKLAGPFRCDLHPRWNRDGTQVCIDSAHDGRRQVYVVDVSRVL